jgi:hypothetical protein
VAQGVARVQIPVQKNKTKNLDFIWIFKIIIHNLFIWYICYGGGFMTIPISLILVALPPYPTLPLHPLPVPLKAVARDFFVLFHIGIWSPSTIYHHHNLLHSPSTSH